jgi:hypothetical protein
MKDTMKALLAALYLIIPSAEAVIYTEDWNPAYEEASITLLCMNHFQYRTTGYLGMKAGLAAQAALTEQLPSLPDGKKLAEAMRFALNSINMPRKDATVPYRCLQFIPQDHGIDDEQLKYFLKHSSAP